MQAAPSFVCTFALFAKHKARAEAEWGAIAEKDLELLHYCDAPIDAFEQLRANLIANHLEPATEQEAVAPGIAKTRG